MPTRNDTEIQADLVAHLRSAGLPLGVSVEKGMVTLEGWVLSEEEHQAVLDIVDLVEDIEGVVDDTEITEFELSSIDLVDAGFDDDDPDDDVATEAMEAVTDAIPYFPPTDPPIEPGIGDDNMQVASGFQSTSLEDNVEERDELATDDELAQRTLRDLREDSATSNLRLYATAVGSTVLLTGLVHDDFEADAAVEVASQTAGVDTVIDRIIIGDRPDTPPERRPLYRKAQMSHVVTPNAAWRATVIANRFRLQVMRDEAEERLRHMEKDLVAYGDDQEDEGTISNHEGDLGADMASAETLVIEVNQVKEEIQQIDEALERMDEGKYGICVDTGMLIEPARLRANPLAIRTVEAQRRWEELDA